MQEIAEDRGVLCVHCTAYRASPYSLYRTDLASFTMGRYNPRDAEGFINLFALPVLVPETAKDMAPMHVPQLAKAEAAD